MHLLCEPVHLPPGVDEDDSLGDGQSLVQITQRVQLPLLQEGNREGSDQHYLPLKMKRIVLVNILTSKCFFGANEIGLLPKHTSTKHSTVDTERLPRQWM